MGPLKRGRLRKYADDEQWELVETYITEATASSTAHAPPVRRGRRLADADV